MTLDWPRLRTLLRAQLDERGMTQAQLAAIAGVKPQTIRNLLGTGGHGEFKTIPPSLAAVEAAVGWAPGSGKAILAGGEPTLMSASDLAAPIAPETTTADTPHGSPLPLAAQDVLDRGELLDTEVIDLSEPGSDFHLLVVAKVGIKDDAEQMEKRRKALEKWIMLRKGIRDMADYRPGPDHGPDAPSE